MKISQSPLWLSVIAGILTLGMSTAGITFKSVYAAETRSWAVQGTSQDIGNLIAVVVLFVSAYFVHKGSIKAFFIWSGVLLYLLYAYLIYAFDVHYNRLFLVYVAIVGLSFYALILSLFHLQFDRVQAAFSAATPAKLISGFLLVLGIVFALLWLSEEVPALVTGQIPVSITDTNLPTNPVHVLDLGFYLPAMLITAVLLWRRSLWGYLLAGPLLVFSIFTGATILIIFLVTGSQGMATSIGLEAVFAIIILMSIALSALYIRTVKYSGAWSHQ